MEVAEYLLEHGADVNAQDKGGLIPLHNAASYGVGTGTFDCEQTTRELIKKKKHSKLVILQLFCCEQIQPLMASNTCWAKLLLRTLFAIL